MFIIISIYSKNPTSLTNFLKFLYKLKKNEIFKLELNLLQLPKKKHFSFFSTLKSPHVNKKSQEQFEYHVYSKKLKIHVSQLVKFLTVWKSVKTLLFSDIKIKTEFCLHNKLFNFSSLSQTNYDKFILKFSKKVIKRLRYLNKINKKTWSNTTTQTSLKLFDIHGEMSLKNLFS